MDLPSLTLIIQIDGTRMRRLLASRSKYERAGRYTAGWSGPLVGTPGGVGMLRPLNLSKIETFKWIHNHAIVQISAPANWLSALNDDALAKVKVRASWLSRNDMQAELMRWLGGCQNSCSLWWNRSGVEHIPRKCWLRGLETLGW